MFLEAKQQSLSQKRSTSNFKLEINTGGRNCDSILKEIYNQAMIGDNTRKEDSSIWIQDMS